MGVVANRVVTIGGKTYQAGDPVTGLSPDKESQLCAQRWLRSTDVKGAEYVVLRPITLKGKTFTRGQRVKVTSLSAEKMSQFLENRILEPAPTA